MRRVGLDDEAAALVRHMFLLTDRDESPVTHDDNVTRALVATRAFLRSLSLYTHTGRLQLFV